MKISQNSLINCSTIINKKKYLFVSNKWVSNNYPISTVTDGH